MIISRTPFRISFFGGGSDYPGWYLKNGGSVLSTAIDKYCYLTIRYLPPFFEHKLRVVYSLVENCQAIDEIKHPAAREVLRFMNMDSNLEIHHDGDLPARSGMGSSSSFTVGLLHGLYALKGRMVSASRLAREAIHVEQKMIGETVGSQDQCAAAHGGLNHIVFHRDGEIDVRPLVIPTKRIMELSDNLMLFYTGIRRTAEEVAKSYVDDIESRAPLLRKMEGMVGQGVEILQDGKDISRFGELLHDAWESKKQLSDKVANPQVDEYYARARKAGAIGGKITGAGGGGFLLLFVPRKRQMAVREALSELLHIKFAFSRNGSQIIFYDPRIGNFGDIDIDDSNGSCVDTFRELDSL